MYIYRRTTDTDQLQYSTISMLLESTPMHWKLWHLNIVIILWTVHIIVTFKQITHRQLLLLNLLTVYNICL